MRTAIFTTIFSLFTILLSAQSSAYFQQDVDYTINVTLDDTAHAINGDIKIVYTNNSPNDLRFIYFHLWPNAYKNNQTALAKQKLRLKETKLQYASAKRRGYIDRLDFKGNGQQLTWQLDPNHIDIAVVNLNEPLKSGESITITTPFYVKIPYSYSRLGHIKTSYQMTQWYPKPAVYDKNGWHPMPYLDIGEFYSEYGSFDVSITLPKNYVVGATGVLQTESEKAFLEEKMASTQKKIDKKIINLRDTFPASATELKTIRYTAENVHDFAWFADKRFNVQKSEVTLASGKKVDTYVMYTYKEGQLWQNAVEYVNRSVLYYSDRVGEYPYPHATAVQSALSAGAGMEYPMITVIGFSGNAESLDEVITHEVGHNWFYGILGSNEREFPWMDEGFNSFYEEAYMEEYYKGSGLFIEGTPKIVRGFIPKDLKNNQTAHLGYLYQTKRGMGQNFSINSDKMDIINYQMNAYMMPAFNLRHLQAYLGDELFEKTMQAYYDEWKFKHPQPKDVKASFEKTSGKDLSWLFDDMFNSTKQLDYAVKGLVTDTRCFCIKVENKGDIAAPFSISTIKNDSIIATKWYEPKEDGIYELPVAGDEYVVDAIETMPEINRKNNRLKAKGVLKKVEPLQLKWLSGLDDPKRSTLYFTPTVAYNHYDKVMVGMAFHNLTVPAKNFEFLVMPMYGFNSGDINGYADFNGYYYPKEENTKLHRFQVGISGRKYNKDRGEYGGIENFEAFSRFTQTLAVQLKPEKVSPITQELQLQVHILNNGNPSFDNEGNFIGNVSNERTIPTLTYEYRNKRFINPFNLKATLIGEGYEDNFNNTEYYIRLAVEGNYRLHYNKRKKALDARVFAGKFLANSDKDFGSFPFAMIGINRTDFYYDAPYIGRSEQEGLWSQQVHIADGGFKTPFFRGSGGGGLSNDFLFAVNLKADLPMNLPLRLPIKPYLDYGIYTETAPAATKSTNIFINGGLMLDIGNGIFAIYMPLFGNDAVMSILKSDRSFGQRITFSLDLARLNPRQLSKISVF